MKAAAIFQSAAQNILHDMVITATVDPSTGYSLETLGYLRPDMRVNWPVGHVRIRLSHPGSPSEERQGDIFALPMYKIDAASPTSVVLTNDKGLSQAIDPPALLGSGLPRTIAIDLSIDTPSAVTRTPGYWEIDIDNVENLVLGGAIAIYGPKQYLVDRDFQWGYAEWEEFFALEAVNEHGTEFVQDLETMVRGVDLSTIATDDDIERIQEWFRASRSKPCLLWFNPDIQDAYLGRIASTKLSVQKLYDDANLVSFSFKELSKGRPIA